MSQTGPYIFLAHNGNVLQQSQSVKWLQAAVTVHESYHSWKKLGFNPTCRKSKGNLPDVSYGLIYVCKI